MDGAELAGEGGFKIRVLWMESKNLKCEVRPKIVLLSSKTIWGVREIAFLKIKNKNKKLFSWDLTDFP